MSAATALPCTLHCARIVLSVLTRHPAEPSRISIRRTFWRYNTPTGNALIDATNPVVFVAAADVGGTAKESPDHLEVDVALMARLDAIRRAGGVAMGMATDPASVGLANPKVAMVGPAADFMAIDGRGFAAESHDLSMRMVSMERVHRAVTLTGAMCAAVAVRIDGTIPHALAGISTPLRVGNPSGILPVEAKVIRDPDGGFHARSATTYRTCRRLMEGCVLVPERVPMAAAAE